MDRKGKFAFISAGFLMGYMVKSAYSRITIYGLIILSFLVGTGIGKYLPNLITWW